MPASLRRIARAALYCLAIGALACSGPGGPAAPLLPGPGGQSPEPGPSPAPGTPAAAEARLEPTAVTFPPEAGTAAVTLSNPGAADLTWSMSGPSWVGIEPRSGTLAPAGSARVTFAPDRSGLGDGSHVAEISLQSNGGDLTVRLTVVVASPAGLSVSPVDLDFGATLAQHTITLANQGGQELQWSASSRADWLLPESTAGAVPPHGSASLVLRVDRDGLGEGVHRSQLAIRSNGGDAIVSFSVGVPAAGDPPSDPPPTEPPPTDPPPTDPPPPPPGGSIALQGRIVDQFSGQGMSGLTVEFGGSSATTGADGSFAVPGQASGSSQPLVVSGPGAHRRRTFARTGDGFWEAVPSSFSMPAFNDMAREYAPETIRWTRDPAIYIDTRAHGFTDGSTSAPQQWIDEVASAVGGLVSDWSDGGIRAASLTIGTTPPPEGTPGTLVVQFDEDPGRYSSSRTVGLARTYFTAGNAVSSARIWVRFAALDATVRRAVFAHELGHTFGMGHMDGSTSSLMQPVVSVPGLTAFDRRSGDFLYGRAPGNASPDTDDPATFNGALVPSALPSGSYEWICGADSDRLERTSHPSPVINTSSSHRTPNLPGR